MTSIELRAELYRQIDTIADNESLMTRALNFINKLAKKTPVSLAPYSYEELNGRITASLHDIQEGRIKKNEDVEKLLLEEYEWLR